jgi:tetratricopeptide (TPR) repeat protein
MDKGQNDKFIQLQHQIRKNNFSLQDYISDLTEWTEEIGVKDVDVKEGKGSKSEHIKKLPPIRSQKLENERLKTNSKNYLDLVKNQETPKEQPKVKPKVNEEEKEFKRDITPMPNYYNKWDNFDSEKASEAVENNTGMGFDKTLSKSGEEITGCSKNEKTYEPSPIDDDLTEEERKQIEKDKFLKGTSGAKPNTKMVVKGGANPTPLSKIESMKRQGNTYFTSLEYEKAVECYTKCLEMNPDDIDIKVVLYSNRAQCSINLKNYGVAEKDALSALRLDKTHVKSLFRHGTALYYLKKYKESKHEFNNLLRLDPQNKNGMEYLRHTDQKLAKIKLEAYEKLYYGEIIGDSTQIGRSVIKVEEIHMDSKLKLQVQEENSRKAKASSSDTKNSLIQEIPDDDQLNGNDDPASERKSKVEFLEKTDVSGITRAKEEEKSLGDFVENEDEEEELRKLKELSRKQKPRKGKRNHKKNKKGKKDDASDSPSNRESEGHSEGQSEGQSEDQTDDGFSPKDQNSLTKIKFSTSNGESEDESNTPNTDGLDSEGQTNLKITLNNGDDRFEDDSEEEVEDDKNYGVRKNRLNFETSHEIHEDKDSSPIRKKNKEECKEIKQKIIFDEEEENLDVVKGEEGEFYTLR